ncbi:16S rRNA (adenine(1518)-N(6)/adenine(1519)-N(6))-dimethyltransferase RsmA [Coraliomargarita akajimensis]|uniref:Ribosomal RNA adenine methylase transferase n=1 Tax=Coraliomargarita akajimensis (strain DSM 45221 / IAM 15411 / JCM 23193 / KCTC 12865 / 04OKA010-24) TaxID=583355 RepID=D5EK14_CORAD|nr:16S rRNA (adenine(1518)-N(6)/adenine(1519)-N(6))-dimethyltransferase RsmA [Coraliomargarita akajimensis]ADE54763.1 ribosomal RNA adenine methylase transferase [Coraliomargarita akajimensis DSM 45221]
MPLNPTSTRELLEALDHLPNKKLGQNFLVDGNIVRKSIELAEIDEGSSVVEVGPGLGTLTRAILGSGAKLWAVERDSTLAEYLRDKVVPQQPNFDLTEGDCLDHPRAGLPEELAESGFKIVANLPYAVSTPWMEAIISGPLPQRMVLMLQKEAADRYIADSGIKNFGAISIFLQAAYHAHSKHLVSANCFHPAPKVDSILLRLDLKENAVQFNAETRACIRRIFTQRRKQLGALCKKDPYEPAKAWFDSLVEKGYSPTVRPEAIPHHEWVSLNG